MREAAVNRSICMFVAASLTVPISLAVAAELPNQHNADTLADAATSLPAVSDINLSIEAAGGGYDGEATVDSGGYGQLGATLSVPIDRRFGAQADLLAVTMGGMSLVSVGGHAFWRDPDSALVGLYGEGLTADIGDDRLNKGRVGIESELYLGRITLSGVVGYEWGNLDIDKGVFAEAIAGYYATDDLKLSAGYGYGFSGSAAKLRADWQLPASSGLNDASVFAEGRVADGDYKAVIAGLTLRFGTQHKSLQRHDREDDPVAWSQSQPHAVASAVAQGLVGVPVDDVNPTSCKQADEMQTDALNNGDTVLADKLGTWLNTHNCDS